MRIKRNIGDVVVIPLREGRYGFGIVLEEPLFAFFKHSDCDPDIDLDFLLEKET